MVPVFRSLTKIWLTPLSQRSLSRFVADERKATNCPVSDAAGSPELPLLGFFCDLLEIRVVGAARATLLLRIKRTAIHTALAFTAGSPSVAIYHRTAAVLRTCSIGSNRFSCSTL